MIAQKLIAKFYDIQTCRENNNQEGAFDAFLQLIKTIEILLEVYPEALKDFKEFKKEVEQWTREQDTRNYAASDKYPDWQQKAKRVELRRRLENELMELYEQKLIKLFVSYGFFEEELSVNKEAGNER
jgi:hypothetical protein